MPVTTRAKTVYFASRCGCGERVRKNWLPPVSRPDERHADRAAQIRQIVELVANRVARPAARHRRADRRPARRSRRSTRWKRSPLKKPLRASADEVVAGHRRVEHRQLDLDRAAAGVDERVRRHRRRGQRRVGRPLEARRRRTLGRRRSPPGSSRFRIAAARSRVLQSRSASARVRRSRSPRRPSARPARSRIASRTSETGSSAARRPRGQQRRRRARRLHARRAAAPPSPAPSHPRCAAVRSAPRRCPAAWRARARAAPPGSRADRDRRAPRAGARRAPASRAPASVSASAARTVQSESTSMPDSTVTNCTGSIGRERALRCDAHQRRGIAQQVEQHVVGRGAFTRPSASTASSRSVGSSDRSPSSAMQRRRRARIAETAERFDGAEAHRRRGVFGRRGEQRLDRARVLHRPETARGKRRRIGAVRAQQREERRQPRRVSRVAAARRPPATSAPSADRRRRAPRARPGVGLQPHQRVEAEPKRLRFAARAAIASRRLDAR